MSFEQWEDKPPSLGLRGTEKHGGGERKMYKDISLTALTKEMQVVSYFTDTEVLALHLGF